MGKKILMLTHEFPPFRGGIGTYASQLALAAHELGHDITVLAPDHGQRCRESDKEEFPFKIKRYHAGHYSSFNLPKLLWRVWRNTRKNGYDIIHAVDWPHILAMASLSRQTRVPFRATVFGTDLLSCADCRHARYLGIRDFFSKPERVMAISQFTRSLYLKRCPEVKPERVALTPLGVGQEWFENGHDGNYVREKYGIPSRHRIILTVARLDERKGHRTVLKALAKLPKRLKNELTYVIVGTGGDATYIADLKRLAALSDGIVRFVGAVNTQDLRALYATSSVFCMPGEPHPQKVEGFGLAYLEAAAQGLPSIASTIGAIPEVVIDGQTGILVKPLDIDGIAKAIERLIRDHELRESLGRAARIHAEQYTWRRCAQLTYEEK